MALAKSAAVAFLLIEAIILPVNSFDVIDFAVVSEELQYLQSCHGNCFEIRFDSYMNFYIFPEETLPANIKTELWECLKEELGSAFPYVTKMVNPGLI